jgi:uncharacterized protein with HEPN domain
VDTAQVGRDAWDKDQLRQLAAERLLEIIGESANTLTDEFRAQHPEVPWRDIIGLSIVLAHPGPRPLHSSGAVSLCCV